MRSSNWAEIKAMNKCLRCTGDNKERRYFTEPAEIERTMSVDVDLRLRRHYMTQKEAVRRYEQREEAREGVYGRNVFRLCQTSRPGKSKVQNRFSRVEAGNKGRITMGVRTGKYGVVVCKSENKW
jgi:hypothetical protein